MKKRPVYKRWWFCATLIMIISFAIVAPFIINESYKAEKGYQTLWGASDVLAYTGTALSFVGAIILGTLTFWQNEKLRETNDRLLTLEKKSKIGYFVPKFKEKIEDYPYPIIINHNLNGEKGIILVANGEDIILVSKAVCIIDNGRTIVDNVGMFITPDTEFKELIIPLELDEFESKKDKIKIDVEMYLENSKGYKYKQTLYLTFNKKDEKTKAYSVAGFDSKLEDL